MKILLLTLATTFWIASNAQTTLLIQDFDNGFPSGWHRIDNDGLAPNNSPAVNFITDAFVVSENPDATNSTDSVLLATSWIDGDADDYLILPNLTMGGFGNYISFDAKSLDASHPDGLEVRISKGGIAIWEYFVEDAVYSNVAIGPYWTNYKVLLDGANIAGDNISIAIRHIGNDQYILALDNIKVYVNDPIGIAEQQPLNFDIYPNPSSDFIVLNVKANSNYEIVDITGKVLLKGTNNKKKINLTTLANGVYFVKVDGYATKKFVKG